MYGRLFYWHHKILRRDMRFIRANNRTFALCGIVALNIAAKRDSSLIPHLYMATCIEAAAAAIAAARRHKA